MADAAQYMRDSYGRAPVRPTLMQENLVFQVVDCVQQRGLPLPELSRVHHDEVPIIRLYGTTADSHSVMVQVFNFEPYLFIAAPHNWSESHSATLAQSLNQDLAQATRVEQTVVRIETHLRRSLLHYTDNGAVPHLRLVVQLPQHIPKLRALLVEQGIVFDSLWSGRRTFSTFESNVIFPLRFLVDNNIGGCNWATIPAGAFVEVQRTSVCQIEVACSFESVQSHEAVGKFMGIPPLRILSMDIECQGRKGKFPEAEHDPVIQIANHVVEYGRPDSLVKCIFVLGGCEAIAGADVHSFATEAEMLIAWSRFLLLVDPDVLTGYNISGFDFPYLLHRAAALRITDRFAFWSRQLGQRTVAKPRQFQSKQMGNRESFDVFMEGRVTMDLLVVLQRDYKLRSYTLNSVAQHFLGEQKEDVHHSIIADLQMGSDATRRRLAVYCLKDAYLPVRLMEKLMIIVNNVEMARVTGVPVGWLLERGQQIKVFSQILRKGRVKDLLFPTIEPTRDTAGAGYEGATVIDPMKGFYNCPIATLDFASLYPSIMMAHNLCYSTLVPKEAVCRHDPDDMTQTPSGDHFMKSHIFTGVLPEVLRELLSARKHAREMMKEAVDPLECAVLNGRQLALKISANSVYGFTGAQVGKLPCLEISASVTSFGRLMIHQTKSLVESTYPDAQVIYGDTDSVMVKCATDEAATDQRRLEQALAFGKEAATAISAAFKRPIRLEFEKVYFPFLLMNKKRYAGLYWTRVEQFDRLDTKGIETVRRDTCPLVSNVLSGVLNRMLIHRSVESAMEFVKGTITDLLLNRLDISHLVITKSFSKSETEYKSKQAHVALVERMRQRDPASAPAVGDRIAYVIVKGPKNSKVYERSEDPIFVLDHNLPIDASYYLENHLAPPLLRVFEAVLDDPSSLFKGEHTNHIVVAAPSTAARGLMKFVSVQQHCIGCRCVVDDGAVCARCKDREGELYMRTLTKRNHLEAVFAKVWTQCQQCQGSLQGEVICSSRDCPVFYLRRKVQRDLHEQQTLMDRFGLVDDW